ncbi:tRNA glutamyl-Q(34) synthetase GluQRS [Hyphococcus sp.]|uniref:tRNA glutamyl-Q(34) synthetase GluQRS n=1 Tax=Hyphococcus sp. TaxID=2038636 RepID=UPI003CCC0F3B
MTSTYVTRFAPSPTGYLHLGHAFSALTAYKAAKDAGGKFILRIEDIDLTRCRTEYESAIYEDLEWLGLDWDPPVRRQSDHFEEYAEALETLAENQLVYRCFKTRQEITDEIARAPHLSPSGPEGPQYIGAPLKANEERSLMAKGAPYAWRLSISAAQEFLGEKFHALHFTAELENGETQRVNATPALFGDAVIGRKDSGVSYHLASVYDDALQNVTHVIRGQDLYHAAHLHRLLQALLALPEPVYRCHRLITDDNGKRFAKRDKSATLRARRMSGATPEAVRAELGFR